MKKRKLGTTGVEVSAMGIGAMSFSNFYGPTDTEKSHAILNKALDLGIDHIDTSNVYGGGVSEERIGSFLANQGKQAGDLFKIATKAGITRDADGNRVYDNSAKHLTEELENSLKRLNVEQVELFYVHRREPDRPIEDVTETLASLVKTGKINQFGFSEIAPSSLARAAAVHPVAAVQSEYSLSTRSPELGLLQKALETGTSIVAFSPVGRGLLTDTPPDFAKCQTIDFMKGNPRFQQDSLRRNLDAVKGFQAFAKARGVATASLAIAWLLHQGEHIHPIPGTRSLEHLQEQADGVSLELSQADLMEIERLLPVGWCHGDRYSSAQWNGPEKYC